MPLVAVQVFQEIRQGANVLFSSLTVGIVLLYLLSVVSDFLSSLLMAYMGERAVLDLRTDVYRHLHTLSLRFFIEHQTGELLSRLSNDISRLQSAVNNVVTGLITNTLTIVGILVVLTILHPGLAVGIPLLFLPVVLLGTLLGLVFQRLSAGIQGHLAEAFGLAENALHHAKTVRAYNREHFEVNRFNHKLQSSFQNSMRLLYWRTGVGAFLNLLGRLAATGVLVLLGYSLLEETWSLEQIIALLYYAAMLWGALYGWMWVYLGIQTVGGATQDIFQILNQKPEVQDVPDAVDLKAEHGHIRFSGVNFAYEEKQWILQNFNLDIAPGQMMALVGSSGIGKTTVLNLLCRFFDPQAGTITIDEVDIRTVTQESLRRHIGIMFQEPSIFATTIYENIRYGNLHATDEEITNAARLVHAHQFIQAMSDGYHTFVGEGGMRLSGGERQRIALARLVLARPRIVLLDEFTASLDTETEDSVSLALKHIVKDCTTLLVSHRLSTVLKADRVAVLHEGSIVETGTPQELIAANGIFSHLFQQTPLV